MRRMVLISMGLVLIAGCSHCGPINYYRVTIPSGLRGRWVVIERSNLDCAPLPKGDADIEIPPDGFLCTSTPLDPSWRFEKYRAKNGSSTTALETGVDILLRRTFTMEVGGCRITGEEFFFGSETELGLSKHSPEEVLKVRYPKCFL